MLTAYRVHVKSFINPNWIDWDFRASRAAKELVMKKQHEEKKVLLICR
jgi:hypothetical protein